MLTVPPCVIYIVLQMNSVIDTKRTNLSNHRKCQRTSQNYAAHFANNTLGIRLHYGIQATDPMPTFAHTVSKY